MCAYCAGIQVSTTPHGAVCVWAFDSKNKAPAVSVSADLHCRPRLTHLLTVLFNNMYHHQFYQTAPDLVDGEPNLRLLSISGIIQWFSYVYKCFLGMLQFLFRSSREHSSDSALWLPAHFINTGSKAAALAPEHRQMSSPCWLWAS